MRDDLDCHLKPRPSFAIEKGGRAGEREGRGFGRRKKQTNPASCFHSAVGSEQPGEAARERAAVRSLGGRASAAPRAGSHWLRAARPWGARGPALHPGGRGGWRSPPREPRWQLQRLQPREHVCRPGQESEDGHEVLPGVRPAGERGRGAGWLAGWLAMQPSFPGAGCRRVWQAGAIPWLCPASSARSSPD